MRSPTTLCLPILLALAISAAAQDASLSAPPLVGATDATSSQVWVRPTAPTRVTVEIRLADADDAAWEAHGPVATDPEADYGPVVTAQHRQRICDYIQMGVDEGAELVVDGREFSLQGFESGFYIGPTLFDRVTPEMKSYQEEIFGPVMQIVRSPSLEEAIKLPSRHQYGNGVSIFTRNGKAARDFAQRVNVGMVGINVPIPVPVAYHTFGGWKRSAFGDANQHGTEGVRFYTRIKTVTQRWPEGALTGQSFVIPTMQ